MQILSDCRMSLPELVVCCLYVHNFIYIYKEELKMVVRKLLTSTQPNRHETSTALCNTYRRVSLRGQHVQIRFSQGACNEKPEKDHPPFCFYEESMRTSVHGSHFLLLWKRRLRNAIVGCRLRSVAVKAHRRWAASASIIYFIQNK